MASHQLDQGTISLNLEVNNLIVQLQAMFPFGHRGVLFVESICRSRKRQMER